MAIGGDPDDLRQHATALRGWADSVDDEPGRLRRRRHQLEIAPVAP